METTFSPMNDSVKSAERVLSLLEALGGAERPQSLAELSQNLAIPKSSALALLRTLQQRGYVMRNESERYLLAAPYGAAEGDWVGGLPRRLLHAARPVVEALVAETRETVNLGMLLPGGTVRALLQVPSPQEVRYVPASVECPAYCTAMGRILLAYAPAEDLTEILGTDRLPRRTDRTETRPTALRKLIVQARSQGYAEIDGEFAESGSGAAAPVFDHTGQPVAALNLATLTQRWHRHREAFIAALLAAAARLSAQLSGPQQHRAA
ncbi:IclR family transcriptional regulator [Acidisphaera sp. L21]|uniref:IclR family transcriptional regulator n=1 Tax=Acidisphaera sp. L21 TaxID=1641851 RepID=UPI00131C4D4B|nr:IclR family transcriptional regulator [Acidisphaera sp. L21]